MTYTQIYNKLMQSEPLFLTDIDKVKLIRIQEFVAKIGMNYANHMQINRLDDEDYILKWCSEQDMIERNEKIEKILK